MDSMRIILALNWSRGMIGNEARTVEPDSSMLSNPPTNIGGINIRKAMTIAQSIIIPIDELTSRVIGAFNEKRRTKGKTIGINIKIRD